MGVIDKLHMLKKILSEAENITAWQANIYTALHNIDAGWIVGGTIAWARLVANFPRTIAELLSDHNKAVHDALDIDADTVDGAHIKSGAVTDTTGADGKIAVNFPAPFTSTPVVCVQIMGDVDYYPVITARNQNGFTVKILKTAHAHAQGATGSAGSHSHDKGTLAAASAGAHQHTNPDTNSNSHQHTVPDTGAPNVTRAIQRVTASVACGVSGAPSGGRAITEYASDLMADETHYHPVPATGYSGHSHTQNPTGSAGSHEHSLSGATGPAGTHSHANPNTNQANAGNTLASTEVTLSYIAVGA
ncbi:MAG TPA: hypothetical protein DIT43_01860 [Dehalococcoidia bacterium]|nr:hypothetical protein [Dehalococcoidia bacterium]